MRPLILTFEGIRSYPGPCPPIDFSGKTLIGIIGDTGAGKSTIFEALCVALYGACSIPAADVRDLIADHRPVMSIELTFRHGGATWRVRRRYHANSRPSQHLLENMDTGETIDNARLVTARIVTLTGLNLDAFRSSVLLPQGRFAELLQATKAKRTQLLEGLFGADTLTAIAERVRERESSLRELFHKAELTRRALLDNPAEEKTRAIAQSKAANEIAARLSKDLGRIRDEYQALSLADAGIEQLGELDSRLTEAIREMGPLKASIDSVQEQQRQIDEQEKALDTEEGRLRETVATTQAALHTAAKSGNTVRALAVAEPQLKSLTANIIKLAATRDANSAAELRLGERKADQERETAEISTAATELGNLESAAKNDEASAKAVQDKVADLIGAIDFLFDHSAAMGQYASERAAALQRVEDCEATLPGLATEVESCKLALREASVARDQLQRQDYAACAGHDLTPGDLCPICRHGIPEGYLPPSSIEHDAQNTADELVETRRGETTAAELRLSTANASIGADQLAAASFLELYDRAAADAEHDLSLVFSLLQASDQLTSTLDCRPDPTALDARIRQAHSEIAARAADPRRAFRNAEKKKISAVINGYTTNAHEHALQSSQTATQAEAALTARRRVAKAAASGLKRDLNTHQESVLAASETEKELRRVIAELPPVARPLLETSDSSWPTDAQVIAALDAVTSIAAQLDEHARHNKQAHEGITGLASRRLELAQRRIAEVDDPTRKARTQLQFIANAIESALAGLSDPIPTFGIVESSLIALYEQLAQTLPTLPPRLADLITTRRQARGDLRKRVKSQLTAALTLHAASGIQHGLTVPGSSTTPTSEPALDDLIKAIGSWQTYCSHAEERALIADGQIEHASRLDQALGPARLRLAALAELKDLLTPAKFPRFLVQTRTSALLGIASEILGTLTADEFGFSADFLIAVRGTGGTREPHNLSGGEKFLGALALSLALAEVHGHGGNRVDALFLDEGFDSLDLTHLAQALGVLRGETNHDRLITIVTHIHTVAELVDDVLLVKRGPAGSALKWSATNDLHDMLWADAAAGLHDIRGDFASANTSP